MKIPLISFMLFISYVSISQGVVETNPNGSLGIIYSKGMGTTLNTKAGKINLCSTTGTTPTTNEATSIYGFTNNSSLTNYGIIGEAAGNSNFGYGIAGFSTGVNSELSAGVLGYAEVNNGTAYGVKGTARLNSVASDFGMGGYFNATTTTNTNAIAKSYGVYGVSEGGGAINERYGAKFTTSGTSINTSFGLVAFSQASGGASEYGALVEASGTSTGTSKIGISATATGTTVVSNRIGVLGQTYGGATVTSTAVKGYATGQGIADTYGGNFTAIGNDSGKKYGIYATASGSGILHAGYFDGKVTIGNATTNYQLGVMGGTDNSIATTGIVGIGVPTSFHITMDGDDIDSWNNTASSKLFLNYNSQADVQIGRASGSNVLTVAGEIQRPQTSDANLVPIAYGSISSNGSIALTTSTNNFTSTKTAVGTYEISITGETYSTGSFLSLATIASASFGFIRVAGVNGKLVIYTADTSGTQVDTSFSFAVYKK